MLIPFFNLLRDGGMKTSITELLTLLEAMKKGVAGESVDDFYYLSRACLVKDESQLDRFDRIFGAYFKGIEDSLADLMADIPDGFEGGLREFCATFPKTLDEVDRMLTRNGIWCGRTQDIGVLTAEEAINFSLSGPMLRASGVAYDVRKDRPYLDYETYEFEVPIGEKGDVYDRYLCRFEEMRQSVRILEQALNRLPDGPINA